MALLNKSNKTNTKNSKYEAIFEICKLMHDTGLRNCDDLQIWRNVREFIKTTHTKIFRATPRQTNFLYLLNTRNDIEVYLMDNTRDKYCHIGWRLWPDGWKRTFDLPSCVKHEIHGIMVKIDREETDALLKLGGFDGYRDIVL